MEDAALWGKWVASEGSSEESEAELTASDSGERRTEKQIIETLLWLASRLHEKGLSVPGRDTPDDLLPSDPDDEEYVLSTEGDNGEADELVYQRILCRGAAFISGGSGNDNTSEMELGDEDRVGNGGMDKGEGEEAAGCEAQLGILCFSLFSCCHRF